MSNDSDRPFNKWLELSDSHNCPKCGSEMEETDDMDESPWRFCTVCAYNEPVKEGKA